MHMKHVLGSTLVLFLYAGGCFAAFEPDPAGAWDSDDGLGGIRIAACGLALCGKIVWLRDGNGPARLEQTVLFGLTRSGASTSSVSAVNPEDGRTYDGTLSQEGRRMVTRDCALGGLFCRSVSQSRG